VRHIEKGQRHFLTRSVIQQAADSDTVLRADDILYVSGNLEQVTTFAGKYRLEVMSNEEDGVKSGLDFYDRYLADALNLLKSGGSVFFEIGDTQGPALARLMQGYGFSEIKIKKDLSGRDRYATALLP
jgi:methylase of polypeptide subunit release factors